MESNNAQLESEDVVRTGSDDRADVTAMETTSSKDHESTDAGVNETDQEMLDIAASTLIEAVDEINTGTVDKTVVNTAIDIQEGGIDDEMEAMFGEVPSTSSEVVASEEPSSAIEVLPPPVEADEDSSSKPADNNDEKTELDQTPDESNLEDMMEALHADKVAKSPPSIQKQSETSGLELKDVLQALTGDLEESPGAEADIGSKRKQKSENKEKKSNKKKLGDNSAEDESVIESNSPTHRKAQLVKEGVLPESNESDGSADDSSTKQSRDRTTKNVKNKESSESDGSVDQPTTKQLRDRKPQNAKVKEPARKEESSESDEPADNTTTKQLRDRKPQNVKAKESARKEESSESDEPAGGHNTTKRLRDRKSLNAKPKETDKIVQVLKKSGAKVGDKKTVSKRQAEDKANSDSEGSSNEEEDIPKTRSRSAKKGETAEVNPSNNESDSETGAIPIRKTGGPGSRSRKGRLPGGLVSRSNKVCSLADCRQQCYPQLGISLHRFPVGNPPMRAFWMRLAKMYPPGPITAYICSKHFTENDYNYDATKEPTDTFYRKLKSKAIPSIGLPVSAQVIQQIRAEVEETFGEKTSAESKKKGAFSKVKQDPHDSEEETSVTSEAERRALRSTPRAGGSKANDEAKKGALKSKLEKSKKAGSRSPSPARASISSQQPTTKTPIIRRKMESETKARTPGTNCSVPCCGNNLFETRAEGLNISYYRFPFDNDLANRWIRKIGDPDLVARTARICSDHFADKDFEGTSGGKRNLKPKAVPSLYLIEKKPHPKDSDEGSDDEEEKPVSRKKVKRKADSDAKKEDKPSKKGKPDTSFITMPLPMIDDIEIKSEPPSDNEVIGQDYNISDPGSEPEDSVLPKKIKVEKENKEVGASRENVEHSLQGEYDEDIRRSRGKLKKDISPKLKTMSLASLSLPTISLERLGKRVIDAADSGSLRVRIKESSEAAKKPPPKYKPGPKSKRKRAAESDDDAHRASNEGKAESGNVASKPGPLSKKKKLQEKNSATPVAPKRQTRKVLKSDSESDSDPDDPPDQLPSPAAQDPTSTPQITFAKSPNPVKVKLAELPKFLLDKTTTEGTIPDIDQCVNDLLEDPPEDLESLLSSDKSDKEKIIQLVEQRISEHTRIIEGKSMGPQQLADHNKILQGSALVLKKLAEKSGKSAPQIIPLNVPDSSGITPGRTIVLKKVADPSKLGLKPPASLRASMLKPDSSPSSPSKTPLALVSPQSSAMSTPVKFTNNVKTTVHSDDSGQKIDPKPCSSMEKIRDYDNLMKRYLSAVLDKNVMSKKYTESKETQKSLEGRLQEKIKELDLMKRKVNSLQAKVNRINSALEYFLTPNQIKLALQETKKVAWSPEEMLTAFTIKHLSKACYLFLRHKLNYPLPGISSLQRWMTMLSKDKADDDEDNIADDDGSDKEDNQELLEEGPGVVNEITGTLEEINACGAPGEEAFNSEEMVDHMKDSNQSSPFQVVFENDSNSNSNRKVIILKKMPKDGKMKVKSKLQISASENDVNVSNIEENDEKNELYRLLPGAKTISMGSSPPAPQKKKYLTSKKLKEKEKISFHRLPQIRPDLSKPPRIQIVKNEPKEEYVGQFVEEHQDGNSIQVGSEMMRTETIIKPEGISTHDDQHQIGESPQKFYTLSDLSSAHMDEHIVENVEHMTEDGQIVGKSEGEMHETLMEGEGMENITMVKEGDVVEHHPAGETSGIEDIVNMAAEQQITFTTTEDIGRAHHFAQIAYAQGNPGEITLHEDMNNMTAVVINDIDEEQLNTLLLSNVVEQKGVEMEGDQTYGSKKIIYQTIDNDKNVIVLQPDSQAFIEEDEGTSSGAPRVYIINEEGHIVSASGGEASALAQEVGYIDSDAFAELGYKLSSDPDQAFTISNLIDNYAIASPMKVPKKH